MLSETEIAHFRSRIGEVLSDGTPTSWQRQFLIDIRDRFERYGTKTRLSDKQLSMLGRLTQTPTQAPAFRVAAESSRSQAYRPTHINPSPRRPSGRSPRRRNAFRVGNPFQPRNPFRSRYPLRSPSLLDGRATLVLVALLMVAGVIGSLLGHGTTTAELSPVASRTPVNTAPAVATKRASFTVTDGDTIRLNDGTRVRLVGFNTPEKFEPKCSREADLGNRASARLKELVATATSTSVALVACSCKAGTEGTRRCNYARSCGKLTVDGRDVGQTLIEEGLAVPFICGGSGCPPTPRPWCG